MARQFRERRMQKFRIFFLKAQRGVRKIECHGRIQLVVSLSARGPKEWKMISIEQARRSRDPGLRLLNIFDEGYWSVLCLDNDTPHVFSLQWLP